MTIVGVLVEYGIVMIKTKQMTDGVLYDLLVEDE